LCLALNEGWHKNEERHVVKRRRRLSSDNLELLLEAC